MILRTPCVYDESFNLTQENKKFELLTLKLESFEWKQGKVVVNRVLSQRLSRRVAEALVVICGGGYFGRRSGDQCYFNFMCYRGGQ